MKPEDRCFRQQPREEPQPCREWGKFGEGEKRLGPTRSLDGYQRVQRTYSSLASTQPSSPREDLDDEYGPPVEETEVSPKGTETQKKR